MPKLTPMMEQYMQIKKQYKYALLFYRLGDFYELFYDDAVIASKELDIVLTGKSVGTEEKAPMCGVPYHAAENYIARLVNNGFKVAVCEQVEDPRTAKGIVKREVVRVITPGTIMDTNALDAGRNNYIMCIFKNKLGFGVSTCDITTGEYVTTQFDADGLGKVIDEIARYSPSEIICSHAFTDEECEKVERIFSVKPSRYEEFNFDFQNADIALCNHFGTLNLFGFGLQNKVCAVSAAGALLAYIKEAQRNQMQNIRTIRYYERSDGMILDISSRNNLEITHSSRDARKKGSLLWVLDNTKTPMGSRLLINRLEQPLTDKTAIDLRLDGTEQMKEKSFERSRIRELLKDVYDIERIMGKLVYGNAHGKEMAALRSSLAVLPNLKDELSAFDCAFIRALDEKWDSLGDVYDLLLKSIADEVPQNNKDEGVIRTGWNEELDKLRLAMTKGSEWLMEIENREREATGIKNLRVRYNRVHGYFIEVSNSYLSQVPDTYIRRQTLTTGERFINPELKELEETLLTAEEKLKDIEQQAFADIKQKVAQQYGRIMQTAALVGELDFIQCLGYTAEKLNYTKPVILTTDRINIKNGRHPVVEQLDDQQYIPNDTSIDNDGYVSIITGPNMAGKSTYMRQVALIVLMAQVGSFVPADSAEIGICDRIFTRVGASDDLATGQSTFMVEMVEVANIINNATPKSLLILDEIGRGTSTFDGMSIAWAVLEHIALTIKARTLFSTHYQEITKLADRIDGVKNYCVTVMERGADIVFLRKIKEGVADKSYGVHVARLAGVPKSVVERANEVLHILTDSGLILSDQKERPGIGNIVMPLDENGNYTDDESKSALDDILVLDAADHGAGNELLRTLRELDLDDMSPRDAWIKLKELQMLASE